MIEPLGKTTDRVPKAKAVCDECGRNEVVACDYERQHRGGQWCVNEGQLLRKIGPRGWAMVRGKLRCPKCEAKRRAKTAQKEQKPMADLETVSAPREPTRAQKLEIVGMLQITYDVEVGRYRNCDTDKTVAEAVGGGVLPGWVAAVREDMFGPDGGNGEIEALRAEVRDWLDRADARYAAACDEIKAFGDAMANVNRLSTRLDKIRAAVGPKAQAL